MENSDLTWVRENAGLSQQQAADLMGVGRRTFSRWETGAVSMPAHKWNAFLVKVNTPASAIPKVKRLPAEHPLSSVVPPDWPGLSLFSDEWTDEMYATLVKGLLPQNGSAVEKEDLLEVILKRAAAHDAHKAVTDSVRDGLFVLKGTRVLLTAKGRAYMEGFDLIG